MNLENSLDAILAKLAKAQAMAATPETRKEIFNGIVKEDFIKEKDLLSKEYAPLVENLSEEQLRPLCYILGCVLAMDEGVDLFTSFLVFLDQTVVPAVKESKDLKTTVENLTKAMEVM